MPSIYHTDNKVTEKHNDKPLDVCERKERRNKHTSIGLVYKYMNLKIDIKKRKKKHPKNPERK